MMDEPGLSLAHTTVMRWVKRFTPEFAKRWSPLAMTAGVVASRRTYVKIRGKWAYLYRAVDRPVRRSISGLSPGTNSKNDHAGRLRGVSPRGA